MSDPNPHAEMLKIIEGLGDSPVMLILDERQQDVQALAQNANGLPPQSQDDVARVEYAVVEQPARLRADKLRHVGNGLLEARAPGETENGQSITVLHYFPVSHVKRFFVRSAVEVDLGA